jgi:hypothetical protein
MTLTWAGVVEVDVDIIRGRCGLDTQAVIAALVRVYRNSFVTVMLFINRTALVKCLHKHDASRRSSD